MDGPNEDLENGATGSAALNALDDDGEQVHDQLPSVEEYKTHLNGTSAPTSLTSPTRNDDDENVHDQLPTVDEYKAATGTTTRRADDSGCSFCCVISVLFFLGLMASAIIIPIAVTKDGRGPRVGLFSRKQTVMDYLITMKISTPEMLNTPGTPQYEAALWIADHDLYRMPIPSLEDNNVHNRFVERYVLAVFYYATGGPRWEFQASFLTGTDVCNWNGGTLTTGGSPIWLGVLDCKEYDAFNTGETQLFVRDIFLYSNRLVGTIPNEIGYLRQLEVFSLPANPGLSGEFGAGMLNLVHLEDLELQYCSLTGTIPEFIGNMVALTNLGLSNNLLVGSLPTSLFSLTKLQLLHLDDNVLEADIEGFGRLTNLYALYAEDAGLSGELTEDMLNGWSNLYDLDLSTNSIAGELPSNIFSHPSMVVLDLHQNKIKGTLPAVSGKNTQLKLISLFENELVGTIPPTIGNIERLAHLDLGLNAFELPFPSQMGLLTNLRYLFTNNNNFTDHDLPPFVGKLTKLRELSMKDNNLTGQIPTFLAALTKLQLLDLDHNKLTGSIPQEIGLLSDLAFLLLNRNQLTGTIPEEMTRMYDLLVFLIDGNSINGTADTICTDPKINVPYFAADCKGTTPEIVCSCCNVCCDDANVTCNNYEWTVNMDPIWEYSYDRVRYTFSGDLLGSTP